MEGDALRIRTIKPEFFTHEGLFEAELRTKLPIRVAFVGLWCVADRDGRFKWEPRRLGVSILPYDKVDFAKVLDALHQDGFVLRYGEAGQYGCIPSFSKHQCVNVREAKSILPSPPIEPETHVHAPVEHVHEYRGVNIPPSLRDKVLARDGAKCARCESQSDLTIDHIFPRSIGGTHAMTNLRVLCRPCNSARPVSGPALIDDLAMDGLTMDDKQRMCMHVTREVHARVEGKGKEGEQEGNTGVDDASFERFWKSYPRRVGKANAEAAWKKQKCEPMVDAIIAAVDRCAQSADWKKEGGQFIPHPATWLNRKGWEDELLPLRNGTAIRENLAANILIDDEE